jgi:hypothetical protein
LTAGGRRGDRASAADRFDIFEKLFGDQNVFKILSGYAAASATGLSSRFCERVGDALDRHFEIRHQPIAIIGASSDAGLGTTDPHVGLVDCLG